jgi:hypothetical protein
MSEDLKLRILQALHEPETIDVELLAHEIAASEDAQAYLLQFIETISAISPASEPAARAEALLEHGLAIAADQMEAEQADSAATQGSMAAEDPKRRT